MFCKNCGKEVPEGTKFCPYCAEPVEETTSQSGNGTKGKKAKKEKKKGKKLPLILGILVIVIIAAVALSSGDDTSEDADTEIVELSSYMDYSEEEIATLYGVDLDEYGYYPDDSAPNFCYVDGALSVIMIDEDSDDNGTYQLFGIGIGTKESALADILDGIFTLTESDTSDGIIDYFEGENGEVLFVQCDSDGKVTSVMFMPTGL